MNDLDEAERVCAWANKLAAKCDALQKMVAEKDHYIGDLEDDVFELRQKLNGREDRSEDDTIIGLPENEDVNTLARVLGMSALIVRKVIFGAAHLLPLDVAERIAAYIVRAAHAADKRRQASRVDALAKVGE